MKIHFVINSNDRLPMSWVKFDWNKISINIETLEIYKNTPSYFIQGGGQNIYEPMYGLYGKYESMEDYGHYWWQYNIYIDTDTYHKTESQRGVKNMSVYRHIDHFLQIFTPILRDGIINGIINENIF